MSDRLRRKIAQLRAMDVMIDFEPKDDDHYLREARRIDQYALILAGQHVIYASPPCQHYSGSIEPKRFTKAELLAIANKVIKPFASLYAAHMRDVGPGGPVYQGLDWIDLLYRYRVGQRVRLPKSSFPEHIGTIAGMNWHGITIAFGPECYGGVASVAADDLTSIEVVEQPWWEAIDI